MMLSRWFLSTVVEIIKENFPLIYKTRKKNFSKIVLMSGENVRLEQKVHEKVNSIIIYHWWNIYQKKQPK